MNRLKSFVKSLDGFDALSIGVIAVFFLLSCANWSKFPIFRDIYYHMGCARSLSTAGGVPLHDFWEFAPAGRPHLYPPLLHIIMFLMYRAGISMSTVGKLVSFSAFHLIMLSCWYGMRSLFKPRDAFYSCALLASCFIFYWQTAVTSAASLVLILTPLAFVAIERERFVAASILVALMLYSHLVLGHLIAFSILIYAIHRRGMFKKIFLVLACAYALWLPFGIHLALNWKSVSLSSPMGSAEGINLHILIWAIASIGIVVCYFKKGKYYWLPSLLFGMVPILLYYPHRFWDGHAFLPLAMLGGAALSGFHGFLLERLGMLFSNVTFAKAFTYSSVAVVLLIFLIADPVFATGGGKARKGVIQRPRDFIGVPGPNNQLQGEPQDRIPPPGGGLEPIFPKPPIPPRKLKPGQNPLREPVMPLGPPPGEMEGPVRDGKLLPKNGRVGLKPPGSRIEVRKTTLLELIDSGGEGGGRPGLQSLSAEPILNKDTEELAKLVEKESTSEQIICSTDPSLGNLITGLTGRPSTGGMFREVSSEEGINADDAYLIILPAKALTNRNLGVPSEGEPAQPFKAPIPQNQNLIAPQGAEPKAPFQAPKNQNENLGEPLKGNGAVTQGMMADISSLNLSYIGSCGEYSLYRNSEAASKRSKKGTVIPWFVVFPMLASALLALGVDCIRRHSPANCT